MYSGHEMYDNYLTTGDAKDEMEEQQREADLVLCDCLDFCEKRDPYSKTPDGICREDA